MVADDLLTNLGNSEQRSGDRPVEGYRSRMTGFGFKT